MSDSALWPVFECDYEWVCNHVLINPTIRISTRLIREAYRHTRHNIDRQRLGKHCLKAGIVVPEQTSIAEQRPGNQVPATTISNERGDTR
jgi:hypothetical protein